MITKVSRPLPKVLSSFLFSSFSDRNSEIGMSRNLGGQGQLLTQDAERVFEQFFNENPPKESEKPFFNSKLSSDSFNSFQILGIDQTANRHAINEAYRKLAIKHHPRINFSSEAEQKFIQISKAYETLTSQLNDEISNGSFIQEFDNSVREQMKNEVGVSSITTLSGGLCQVKIAELYTQTKNVKRFGNMKQIKIVKQYNRDGNLIKVTRLEKYNCDGLVSVSETYDNGDDIKAREFIKQTQMENKESELGQERGGPTYEMRSVGGAF